jgi:hypothetical protein
MSAPVTRRDVLSGRIRLLVAATITYNVIEAVIALAEGTRVSSTALIGFGLDSAIEVSSAAAVAWQFSAKDPETREKAALRFIAFSFFALALYVVADSVLSLLGMGEAGPSAVGIGLAAASLVIMPVLSWAQRRARRELGSANARGGLPADVAVPISRRRFWLDSCSTPHPDADRLHQSLLTTPTGTRARHHCPEGDHHDGLTRLVGPPSPC